MNFNRHRRRSALGILVALATGTAHAHSEVQCTPVPKVEWRPHTELQQKLNADGWKVRRMVATESCYEVYAKDPQDRRIEAFFHPKTFERVEPK